LREHNRGLASDKAGRLVKRIVALLAAAVAALAAVKSWRTRKADAELWEEATRDLG
jgi:hypothetical protein